MKETGKKSIFSAKALESLFACAKEAVFCALNDERLTVTEVSDSVSVYGYSPEEFISGKIGWSDVMHPDDRKSFAAHLESKTNTEHEHRIFTKSGEMMWVACVCMEADGAFLIKIRDVGKRKQYEEKLHEREIRLQKSESTLHSLIKHSPDGIIFADSNGTVLEWSKGHERTTGFSKEDAVGKPIWELANSIFAEQDSEESRKKTETEMRNTIRSMEPVLFTRKIINQKTGEQRILNSQYFPFKTPDGMVMGIIGHDVTELMLSWDIIKQSEMKLTAEMNRIQVLGDNIPDGALFRFMLDNKTGKTSVIYAGSTWEKFTGVTSEEVVADYTVFFKHVHPDDVRGVANGIEESVGTLSHFHCEFRMIVNGDIRWLQLSSHPHAYGDAVIWEGILLEVTDRKEAELKLKAEKERLQSIGDNLPEATLYRFVHDRNSEKMYMEYVSATWEKVTGISPEIVINDMTPFFDAVHPDDLPNLMDSTMNTERDLTNFKVEIRMGDKDMPRWLLISSYPHKTGNLTFWDGVIFNITNRKEIEAELAIYREDLEMLVKERTEELESANEELASFNEELESTNEELAATNDELKSANDEISASNEELDKYRTKLEIMVAEKTSEIVAQQARLEEHNNRQAILIKVLQILQSSENLSQAIETSLAEIGKHIGASHTYTFEQNLDGKTFGITHEWHNKGEIPVTDKMQNLSIELFNPWLELCYGGNFVCTSDINTMSSSLSPDIVNLIASLGVKSILNMPLLSNGVIYGSVSFDDCNKNREWTENEIEILKSFSRIISNAISRNKAENTVHRSQQIMQTVMNNIGSGIFVTDIDTSKILFGNRKIRERAGEDIEGKICWQTLVKNQTGICDFCSRPHLLNDKQYSDRPYRWEYFNNMDGRWYEELSTLIEWIDGRTVHLENSIDVTDRKIAEESIRRSEEMYRQLIVASPDAIVVCTPAGRLRYVSSKAYALFGLEKNVVVSNLRILRFVHPHDRHQVTGMYEKLKGDDVLFVKELPLIQNNGSEFIGEISAATVKDANGNTISVIMVIRDITRRKMDELELIRAKEKAEESDKLKSAFLANISHEIRTPLNAIVGFMNIINSAGASQEIVQDCVSHIDSNSSHLLKLIDDIIDVAKIEVGQMELKPVPLHLNNLMYELKIFFESHLRTDDKKHIELILDDVDFIDSCVIIVDATRLSQVLNDLLENAIKFTERGFIRFGYRKTSKNMIEFVVEDSGIGLAPDQTDVIFERFRQAELGNTRRYGGTGLGLSIARSLVQLMGGEMWVTSTEGIGSSFYFTVPYRVAV